MSPVRKRPSRTPERRARTARTVPGTRAASATSQRIQLAYSIPVQLGSSDFAKVEIRVSNRRRKTSQAHLEAGKVVVVVPSNMTVADREDVAARLALRMLGHSKDRRVSSDWDLERRASRARCPLPRRGQARLHPVGREPVPAMGIVHTVDRSRQAVLAATHRA